LRFLDTRFRRQELPLWPITPPKSKIARPLRISNNYNAFPQLGGAATIVTTTVVTAAIVNAMRWDFFKTLRMIAIYSSHPCPAQLRHH
jgi:hypothetical protein